MNDEARSRRFVIALVVLFAMAVSFAGCGTTQRAPIGGHWEIVTETSGIPEAGGHHPFLYRHSPSVNVEVDTDTYSYRFIAPDSVLWIGMDNGGLWIATGDHEPLLLQAGFTGTEPVPAGQTLDLGPLGPHRVSDLAALAARQPPLTSAWKPPARVHSSPTTLPG